MPAEILCLSLIHIYTSPDVLGIELGGALKNVVALAAGIADGLGYGDNTKAALITRGITEIARLGTAMGGNFETFCGLTGIGEMCIRDSTMIAYIGENEQILTADGLADLRFGFTASETGHIHVYEIVALDIAVKGRIVFHFVIMDTLTEFYHEVIAAADHFFCGRQSDALQRSHGHGILPLA